MLRVPWLLTCLFIFISACQFCLQLLLFCLSHCVVRRKTILCSATAVHRLYLAKGTTSISKHVQEQHAHTRSQCSACTCCTRRCNKAQPLPPKNLCVQCSPLILHCRHNCFPCPFSPSSTHAPVWIGVPDQIQAISLFIIISVRRRSKTKPYLQVYTIRLSRSGAPSEHAARFSTHRDTNAMHMKHRLLLHPHRDRDAAQHLLIKRTKPAARIQGRRVWPQKYSPSAEGSGGRFFRSWGRLMNTFSLCLSFRSAPQDS